MNSLLIRNARIVDGTEPSPTDPVQIAIEDGKIKDIAKQISFAADVELDLSGLIAMPGLIDCHVHAVSTTANLGQNIALPSSLIAARSGQILKDMLMRGFTTVRDLGGADRGLQQAVEEGFFVGPRLIICGKALSQTGGHTDFRGAYDNRDVSWYAHQLGSVGRICDGLPEVQRATREELKGGAQFIKVMADGGVASPSDPIGYQAFSIDELKAIVEIARNFGTYVAAHLYDDLAIVRALDCGIECIEHGNFMSDDTIARVSREGAYVVPTNITYDMLATKGAQLGLPAASVEKIETVREAGLDKLAKFHEAGITMGYGSDLLGDMHREQSGEFILRGRYIPSDAVIRSATVDAAKVLRMEGQIGELKVDAYADLIAVDGNPLESLDLLTHQGTHIPLIIKQGNVVKNRLSR